MSAYLWVHAILGTFVIIVTAATVGKPRTPNTPKDAGFIIAVQLAMLVWTVHLLGKLT